MNERVKDEQHAQRIVPMAGSLSEHHHLNSYGIGVRIDPAHTPHPETEARQVEWQNLEHFVSSRPAGRPAPAPTPTHVNPEIPQIDTQYFDEFSQRTRLIHNQIQAQKAALDQREIELRSRLIELEEDQQRFHHQAAHNQTQLDARRNQLQKNEATLAERMIAFELQSRKLDTEAATIRQQRADIEHRKKAMREEILAELGAEKRSIDSAKAELQKDLQQAKGLKESLQDRLNLLTSDSQKTLKDEREKLWRSLSDEWEQRKVTFQQEVDSWTRTREHEKSEIERERAMFDATIASANAEFLNAREALGAELAELRQQQANQLELEQEEWQQARLREEAELAILIERQRAELLAERDAMTVEFDSLRAQHTAVIREEQGEWERTRAAFEQLILAEREKHAAAINEERTAWEQTRAVHERQLAAEREQHTAAIDEQQAEWERTRTAFEQQLIDEREQHSAGLAEQQAEWERTRASFAQQLIDEREQHSVGLAEQQAEWERTRAASEQQFAAECELRAAQLQAMTLELEEKSRAHELVLKQQLDELHARRELLEQEISETASRQSAAMAEEREEWEQTRRNEFAALEAQRTDLLAWREQVEQELLAIRQQHDQSVQTEREEWERTLREQQAQLEAQQVEWQQTSASLESQHAEWIASRDSAFTASREALELEFMSVRQEFTQQLQAERSALEKEIADQKAVLQTRRDEQVRELTLIENRIRFQQDHLEKSRAEFEQAQNEHRRERQIELQRLEEAEMLILQRQRQVDLYRSSIDEREKSLDREQEVLSRTRKSITSTADFDRMNFQAEKHAWEQERQFQQNELRRQQEALAARNENLESRGIRLDKLRAELEETHRATLEMRLAVEESWAQLTEAAGEEGARFRVDQVRQSLAGYHQQMHESLSERRREHVESQTKFERQRAEFNDERQQLTLWLTKRDEDLQLGEERLRIAANESAANHAKWLAARDRWLMEKTEAEQLIRRLLLSLGDNSRNATRQFDPDFRWDEVSALFNDTPTHQG